MRISPKNEAQDLIKISGNGYSEFLFMNQLLTHIKPHNITNINYSPLSNKMIERIRTTHFTVITNRQENDTYDTSALCEVNSESVRLNEYRMGVENLATLSFAEASGSHFELEKIYKEATNFSYNEEIFDTLIGRIDMYLERK